MLSADTNTSPDRLLTRRRLVWILSAWTLWGLLWSAEGVAQSRLAGRNLIGLGASLAIQLPLAFVWAALTPGILWLGRRLPPFVVRRWLPNLLVHMVAMVLVVLGTASFYYWTTDLVQGPPSTSPFSRRVLVGFTTWILSDGLLYWAVILVDWASERSRRAQERLVHASQLEAQLAQARLQALQMQLHPHFLFNALHTVATLVRTGQGAVAVRVVAGLGDLLRRVLEGAETTEVPLNQELEFIRSYLEIEQVRFRDRLRYTIQAEPETLDAAVPQLVLQPLVENAIRHGVAPLERGGHLIIVARRIGDQLCLLVSDDGVGLTQTPNGGVGIANTRKRLQQLYGTAYSFEVLPVPEGGVEARIGIPFRLSSAEWKVP